MIPFSPPRIDDKTIEAVTETLKSGWITTGPKVALFEEKITEYTKAKATVCVNSATAGLEIILRWFGVGKGDEVIVPAYTYCATANVVIHTGAIPVMVDINEDDYNISIQSIKSAITKRTKVIIPVDIAGFPCDYDEIISLIDSPAVKSIFSPNNEIQQKLGRILLLADSAHSFGAVYKNKKSGILADISVFSFHAVKNLTTAEGGAITLNLPDSFDNMELRKFLKVLGLHGQNKDALAKSSGNWKYDVVCAGYKINMTDIQAAIGLVEFERYDTETLKRRHEICMYYNDFFKKDKRFSIPVFRTEDKTSCYHLYMLSINNADEETRNEIITRIIDKGVAVNVHFQPLPLLSFYKNNNYNIKDFPKAYNAYKKEISLPVYYNLTQQMLETITDAVIKSVNEVIPE
jgi:dTDP-4-amino-4,6-dideoxygalactose transaminase